MANKGNENIGIVIAGGTGHGPTEALKPHARIHVTSRQGLQSTIGHALKFHKDQVPELDHLGVVFIDQFPCIQRFAFFFTPQIHVDFGTRTARTGIPHFPKIIFFVTRQNAILRNPLLPKIPGLMIRFQSLGGIPLKISDIQPVLGQTIRPGQQFPCPSNGFLFEVIPKGPIAQHLKKRVVVGILTHIFQVVVFARYP